APPQFPDTSQRDRDDVDRGDRDRRDRDDRRHRKSGGSVRVVIPYYPPYYPLSSAYVHSSYGSYGTSTYMPYGTYEPDPYQESWREEVARDYARAERAEAEARRLEQRRQLYAEAEVRAEKK